MIKPLTLFSFENFRKTCWNSSYNFRNEKLIISYCDSSLIFEIIQNYKLLKNVSDI